MTTNTREYNRTYQANKRATRVAAGLCPECGSPPAEERKRCRPCLDRIAAQMRRFYSTRPRPVRRKAAHAR